MSFKTSYDLYKFASRVCKCVEDDKEDREEEKVQEGHRAPIKHLR